MSFDFYMYELIDGGAGAIGAVPCALFVFREAKELIEHLEAEWGELSGGFDDESLEDSLNRLGADEHVLWTVEGGRVVASGTLDDFSWLQRGARKVRLADVAEVEALASEGPDGLEFFLDVEALTRALPRVKRPPRGTEALTVAWAVPRGRSHVGDTVRLGAMEIPRGSEFFG